MVSNLSLQLKSMYEVFNDLVSWTTARTDRLTDYSVGSAIRTMYEAVSVQLEEFYFAMKQNTLYAIEESVYDAFGFSRREAVAASGYVTVYFKEELPSSYEIPAGTVFSTGPAYNYRTYASSEDIYAPAGSTAVLVPVECQTAGEVGNVPVGAIDTVVTSSTIIDHVGNTVSITNGVNEETSQERKERFRHYIRTLARGTRDAVLYGCLEVDGVAGAYVDDSYIGYVRVYAHDAAGELQDELRKAILANEENYRAAGIEVQVLPIVKKTVDLDITVMIEDGYDTTTYADLIKSIIWDSLENYTVSQGYYNATIIHTIMDAYDDVVVNIDINSGKDVKVDKNELIRPGKISVACINVSDWNR